MACEIMLQAGNTRANICKLRLAPDRAEIMIDKYKRVAAAAKSGSHRTWIDAACLRFSPRRMLPDAATQHSVKAVDLAVEKNLKPEQTAASKLALLDWKRSLLETFAIN